MHTCIFISRPLGFAVVKGEAWDAYTKVYAPHVLALTHANPGARTHDTPGPKANHSSHFVLVLAQTSKTY